MDKNRLFKYFNKGVSFIFIFSVLSLICLYIYHRGIVLTVSALILITACLAVFIGIFLYLAKVKRSVLNTLVYKFSLFRLLLLFFLANFVFANFFLVVLGMFDFDNFLSIEYSLASKLFGILLFYFCYFLLSTSLGEFFLTLFKVKKLNRRDKIIFAYALGFSFFSLTIFFIAVSGLLYKSVILFLLVASILFSYKYIRKNLRLIFNHGFSIKMRDKKNFIFIFVFILLSIQLVFIAKPVPVTTDDLHTYWNAPLEYSRAHSFLVMTNTKTASASQNNEMIYAGIITLFETKYIGYFQFFSFIFFLFAAHRLAELYFNKKIASLAVLSSVLIPWNFYYMATTKVEMNTLLFSVVTTLALYKYFLEKKLSLLVMFAFFSGILFGIKYFGLFLILPLSLFLLIYLLKNYKFKKASHQFLIAVSIFFLAFSPWLIKNCYYFGQPLYPSGFLKFGQSENITLSKDLDYMRQRGSEINALRHSDGNNINIFSKFVNQKTGKNIDKFLWINYGLASPLFLILFFLLAKKNKKLQYLNLLILFYFCLWNYLGESRPWYGIFAYTLISFMLIYYVFKFKYFKYLYLIFLLSLTFVYGAPLYSNLRYISGEVSAEEYKQGQLLFLKTATYINQEHILDEARLLLVGDTAVATIEHNGQAILSDPYLSHVSYSLNQGDDFFKNDLLNNGFKYLIYSSAIDDQIMSWPQDNKQLNITEYLESYTGDTPSLYKDIEKLKSFLDNNAELIFDDFYKLYKIKK